MRINNTIKYSCDKCRKLSYKPISDLIKRCSNVSLVCNGDLDKFLILLRKGVDPYESMSSWSRFNECKNPPFEKYYSKLNMSNISKEDYVHSQKIWNTSKIQDLGEYHNLYNKTDVLLLADVFENFRKMCHDIYGLDPVRYVSAPNLAWQACLKQTNVNLELLTNMDMLLMFEQGIRAGICHTIVSYVKANKKIMIKIFQVHF